MIKIQLKSNPPNYPKHIVFLAIALWGVFSAIYNHTNTGYIFAGIFGGFTLLELLIYSRTTLILTENDLSVKRVMLIGLELDNYSVALDNIRASHYEVEKYDEWQLFHRFFIEILFPSGQNTLTILRMDGKKHEIIFNANERVVKEFMEKLPDRVPNG